ncbi:MAG: ABC transporter ATP-binding protein [Ruminococcaceae bacterium]|nr:ABC transporter ATP-binding protein [Oscillospiraceae bacterium]
MKKYKPYVKKYLPFFIFGPFFMVIEACGEFILPFLNKDIIDNGAAKGDVDYILSRGILMAVIAVIMLITGILGAYFTVRASSNLAKEIRRDTFYKIQTFSFSDIDRFSTGSLITRITNDITQVQTFTQSLLRGCFRSPIMIVGALIMSFALSPSLAVVILAIVPILAITTYLIIKKASPAYTEMQESLDGVNTGIKEAITNEKVIKSFVREDHEKSKFSVLNEKLRKKSINALKMMVLLQPISALSVNIATLAVVWLAGEQIMVGDMEVGTLTAFITYLSQVLTSLNFMSNIFLQGTRAAASDKRISEVLDTEPDIKNAHELKLISDEGEEIIRFSDVCFKYFKNNRKYTLENISFSVNKGELVGIIGSTGSGKTTLVSMIPRLYDVDEGRVLYRGVDVRDMDVDELRKRISLVLQKNTLFLGSVEENLRWGKENASMDELIFASTIADAHGFVSAMPKGYSSEVEQGGANLSGGQRQRLCIARGILKNPEVLILDDSTSAVDTATDARIRKAFREKLPEMTKIIIAQRISSVIDADKIIVLDSGRLVGVGTHKELMRSCEEYREIYYSQKERQGDEE